MLKDVIRWQTTIGVYIVLNIWQYNIMVLPLYNKSTVHCNQSEHFKYPISSYCMFLLQKKVQGRENLLGYLNQINGVFQMNAFFDHFQSYKRKSSFFWQKKIYFLLTPVSSNYKKKDYYVYIVYQAILAVCQYHMKAALYRFRLSMYLLKYYLLLTSGFILIIMKVHMNLLHIMSADGKIQSLTKCCFFCLILLLLFLVLIKDNQKDGV